MGIREQRPGHGRSRSCEFAHQRARSSQPEDSAHPPVPVTVSFDIEWSGVVAWEQVTNEMQDFTGQFVETAATINWSANQAGFLFVSEKPNPARNFYSVIGHERNGFFFH